MNRRPTPKQIDPRERIPDGFYGDSTDDSLSSIGNRLRLAWKKSGLTQQEFADRIGIEKSTFNNYIIGKRVPKTTTILRLNTIFHVRSGWMLTGKGSMYEGGVKGDDRFFFVPLMESRVTAGPEGELLCEEISDEYPFQQWWIQKLVGKDPQRQKALCLVRVRGDSMIPTINPNETILVDTSEGERSQIRPGKIYLVRQPDGGVSVKRLVLNEKPGRPALISMSDNPSFQPFEIELERDKGVTYYVLGRVRWVGKEID